MDLPTTPIIDPREPEKLLISGIETTNRKYKDLYKELCEIFNQYLKYQVKSAPERAYIFTSYVVSRHGKFLKKLLEDDTTCRSLVDNIMSGVKITSKDISSSGNSISLTENQINKINTEVGKLNSGIEAKSNLEEIKLILASIPQQIIKDSLELLDSALQVMKEKIQGEVKQITEDSYEKAKEIDQEFRKKQDIKEKRSDILKRERLLHDGKYRGEFTRKYLRDLNNLDRKIENVLDPDSKGEFKHIIGINTFLIGKLRLQKKLLQKKHAFILDLHRFRRNLNRETNQSKQAGIIFVATKAGSAFTLGVIQGLTWCIKGVRACAKGFGIARKILRIGLRSAKKILGLAWKGIKFLGGMAMRIIGGVASASIKLLLSPFRIFSAAKRFLERPIIKTILSFLASDTGAVFLGFARAFLEKYLLPDVLKTYRQAVQFYRQMKAQFDLYRKDENLFWTEFDKEWSIDQFSRHMFSLDINEIKDEKQSGISSLITTYQSARDRKYGDYLKNPFHASGYVIYSMMIASLKARSFLNQKFCKFYTGLDEKYSKSIKDQIEVFKTSGKNKQKLDDIRNDHGENSKLFDSLQSGSIIKTMFSEKMKNIKHDLGQGNITYDSLKYGFRKLAKSLKQKIETIGDTIVGSGISIGLTSLGAALGSFIPIPGLGSVIGGLVGAGIGAIINYSRERAQGKERILRGFSERNELRMERKRDQRMTELGRLVSRRQDLLAEKERNDKELENSKDAQRKKDLEARQADIERELNGYTDTDKGVSYEGLNHTIDESYRRGDMTYEDLYKIQQLEGVINSELRNEDNAHPTLDMFGKFGLGDDKYNPVQIRDTLVSIADIMSGSAKHKRQDILKLRYREIRTAFGTNLLANISELKRIGSGMSLKKFQEIRNGYYDTIIKLYNDYFSQSQSKDEKKKDNTTKKTGLMKSMYGMMQMSDRQNYILFDDHSKDVLKQELSRENVYVITTTQSNGSSGNVSLHQEYFIRALSNDGQIGFWYFKDTATSPIFKTRDQIDKNRLNEMDDFFRQRDYIYFIKDLQKMGFGEYTKDRYSGLMTMLFDEFEHRGSSFMNNKIIQDSIDSYKKDHPDQFIDAVSGMVYDTVEKASTGLKKAVSAATPKVNVHPQPEFGPVAGVTPEQKAIQDAVSSYKQDKKEQTDRQISDMKSAAKTNEELLLTQTPKVKIEFLGNGMAVEAKGSDPKSEQQRQLQKLRSAAERH